MAGQSKDIETIYNAALQKASEAERNAYLEKVCGDDQVLRARVETLLRAHEQAGDFLEPASIEPGVTLDSSPAREGPGTKIGHYELLELIGEGGMGLVYLAEQKEPVRRKVVLKIVKPGMDSKQVIARFEAERQVLAILDHPNIAHVFDAGTTDTGRPYFVMEYVKGMSITRYCDEKKLSIEKRLRLFEQVCEGIHHAHQKGIIHRDVKPSNILISVHGDKAVPKIIDFGIAKAITQPLTDKTFVTFQGQLLGTPEYMSPEQVDLATQDIDTRSDIYSLGVVLYELLAGVLPFEEESFGRHGFAEIQRTIRDLEPASPSMRLTSLGERAKTIAASRGTQVIPLARRLHRELEWIPLKAMRKDRCRRYRSASELADDIHNYLTGRPLIAGPETAIYRVQKFVHKHAGSVATVALVAAAIVVGLIISTAMYFRAEDARQKEAVARTQAEQAEKVADEQRGLAEQRAEELRRSLYANSVQLADAKYREGNAKQVRSLLDSCPEDLRGWEWNRLNYVYDESLTTLHFPQGSFYRAVLNHDNTCIISCGDDEKTIVVWDLKTGEALQTFRGHEKPVYGFAISPDGRRIVSGGDEKTIEVWDVQSGKEVMTLQGHRGTIWSLAFSPDGKQILSGSQDKTVKLWDAKTGVEVLTLRGHEDTGVYGYFSPDGKRIISAGDRDGKIKVWNAINGDELLTISWTKERVKIWCVAFSPDSRRIVLGSVSGIIQVWDIETGALVFTIPGNDGFVYSLTYSPDGKFIASGLHDRGMIKIWDAQTGEAVKTLRGHDWVVECVRFSPDSQHLLSVSQDDTVKLWDSVIDRTAIKIGGHARFIQSIAFSPDGRQIASSSADSTVKLWDSRTGEAIKTIRSHEFIPSDIAFSPDGRCIAVGERQQKVVRVWDTLTGTELLVLRGHKGDVRCTAYSSDGNYIVSGSDDKTVKVWDALKGVELATLVGHDDSVVSVAFSPDDKTLVSGSWDKTIRVWDLEQHTELMTLRGHEAEVMAVVYSPDGKCIASASLDRTAKIWNATTGVELRMLYGHRQSVYNIVFSPDGNRVVTSGRDTAKVWDTGTGVELVTLPAVVSIGALAFSPDGKTIAAATIGGSLTLYKSTLPATDYEPLRHAELARKLVETLHARYGSYHDVITQVQNDGTLDPDICRLATQMANSRKWEDADKLMAEALQIVNLNDKDLSAYQTALEKAGRANTLEPNDPAILNTLGAAWYRTGSYDEALKVLTMSNQILLDAKEDPDPVNTALMAMTLYRIGQLDEAKATLQKLRELCKDDQFLYDIQVLDLLTEAEKLITGEEQGK
jgi:WD40 repeat protein/serine/threonine protein kinase